MVDHLAGKISNATSARGSSPSGDPSSQGSEVVREHDRVAGHHQRLGHDRPRRDTDSSGRRSGGGSSRARSRPGIAARLSVRLHSRSRCESPQHLRPPMSTTPLRGSATRDRRPPHMRTRLRPGHLRQPMLLAGRRPRHRTGRSGSDSQSVRRVQGAREAADNLRASDRRPGRSFRCASPLGQAGETPQNRDVRRQEMARLDVRGSPAGTRRRCSGERRCRRCRPALLDYMLPGSRRLHRARSIEHRETLSASARAFRRLSRCRKQSPRGATSANGGA